MELEEEGGIVCLMLLCGHCKYFWIKMASSVSHFVIYEEGQGEEWGGGGVVKPMEISSVQSRDQFGC